MNKIMENKKRMKTYITGIILLFCTVVSGYGIFTAPESDVQALERELIQAQDALLQYNQTEGVQAQAKEMGHAGESYEAAGTKGKTKKEKEKSITVIGDSVFLLAAPSFQKLQKNAVIDTKVSRQVYQAIDVAKQLNKKGKLGDTVIISLGINGRFNQATGQALIDYLGKKRTVYWINAYGKNVKWQNDVNKTIQALVDANENLHLIAWSKEGKKHPNWFYRDGMHLNAKGQIGFARFVNKQIK